MAGALALETFKKNAILYHPTNHSPNLLPLPSSVPSSLLSQSKMASALALKTFKKNAMFYHPICRKMVAADLGLRLNPDGSLEEGLTEGGKEGGVEEAKGGKKVWGEGCPLSQEAMLLVGVGVGAAVLAGLFVLLRKRK